MNLCTALCSHGMPVIRRPTQHSAHDCSAAGQAGMGQVLALHAEWLYVTACEHRWGAQPDLSTLA